MTRIGRNFGLSATALILSTTALAADVTPEDVWSDLATFSEALTATLSGEVEEEDDGTYVIENATLLLPQAGLGTSTATVPELRLEPSDGNVVITIPAPYTLVTTVPEDRELEMPEMTTRSTVTFEGRIVAQGNPGAIVYLFDDNEVTGRTTTVAPTAEDEEGALGGFDFSIAPLSGTVSTTRAEGHFDGRADLDAGVFSYSLMPIEEENGTFSATFETFGYHTSARFSMPHDAPAADMDTLLELGEFSSLQSSTGSRVHAEGTMEGDTPQSFVFDVDSGPTQVSSSVEDGTLRYQATAADVIVSVQSPNLPVESPSVNISSIAMGLGAPLIPKDEAEGFAAIMEMQGITLSEELWSFIDPSGSLSREPGELRISLSGRAKLTQSLLSPSPEATFTAPPIEIYSAKLQSLSLSLAGVSLRGAGSFATPADTPSDGPLPPLEGSLSLELIGLQSTLEKLSAAGTLPPEAMFGVMMGLGTFAKPAGEDTFVTDIEISPETGVTLNGMPMPF